MSRLSQEKQELRFLKERLEEAQNMLIERQHRHQTTRLGLLPNNSKTFIFWEDDDGDSWETEIEIDIGRMTKQNGDILVCVYAMYYILQNIIYFDLHDVLRGTEDQRSQETINKLFHDFRQRVLVLFTSEEVSPEDFNEKAKVIFVRFGEVLGLRGPSSGSSWWYRVRDARDAITEWGRRRFSKNTKDPPTNHFLRRRNENATFLSPRPQPPRSGGATVSPSGKPAWFSPRKNSRPTSPFSQSNLPRKHAVKKPTPLQELDQLLNGIRKEPEPEYLVDGWGKDLRVRKTFMQELALLKRAHDLYEKLGRSEREQIRNKYWTTFGNRTAWGQVATDYALRLIESGFPEDFTNKLRVLEVKDILPYFSGGFGLGGVFELDLGQLTVGVGTRGSSVKIEDDAAQAEKQTFKFHGQDYSYDLTGGTEVKYILNMIRKDYDQNKIKHTVPTYEDFKGYTNKDGKQKSKTWSQKMKEQKWPELLKIVEQWKRDFPQGQSEDPVIGSPEPFVEAAPANSAPANSTPATNPAPVNPAVVPPRRHKNPSHETIKALIEKNEAQHMIFSLEPMFYLPCVFYKYFASIVYQTDSGRTSPDKMKQLANFAAFRTIATNVMMIELCAKWKRDGVAFGQLTTVSRDDRGLQLFDFLLNKWKDDFDNNLPKDSAFRGEDYNYLMDIDDAEEAD